VEKNTLPTTGSYSFAALRRSSLEGKGRKAKQSKAKQSKRKEGIQGRHWEEMKGN
jgi:hypothetical protein